MFACELEKWGGSDNRRKILKSRNSTSRLGSLDKQLQLHHDCNCILHTAIDVHEHNHKESTRSDEEFNKRVSSQLSRIKFTVTDDG
ncbi:hypothetical protein JTB14_007735 [Gonioctena quinquepunctata]|nr:hypothetical protein JTB14_007735 [Gonioctena quinquepunctata]